VSACFFFRVLDQGNSAMFHVYHHVGGECRIQSTHQDRAGAMRECRRLNETEDSVGHYYSNDVLDNLKAGAVFTYEDAEEFGDRSWSDLQSKLNSESLKLHDAGGEYVICWM
jgi:hypothetical protein